MAAQSGATLAELMARIGHSTPQAALRYQHAAQARDAVIAARMSKEAKKWAKRPPHDETPAMWPRPGIVPGSSSRTIAEGRA
ncbi:hypothetical protein BN13_390048 [Nostocoides jenkinsii Ben 74]|uniref:Tyr recombinase domain-containing protein n=1 Tax=Nostocoides jenkinsii Ben 74 TaxID=1193518 RepID=A0A077M815_9MICO|nr:hypothetical protein BN13_390048 [Tetrasphaera jenkinsii Ben 74]